jgi:PAS domain S-box-containing protein
MGIAPVGRIDVTGEPLAQVPASAWIGEVLCGSQDYAVVAVSPDGHITGWYGAADRVFGHSSERITGQPFAVLFTQADIDNGIPQTEMEQARLNGRSEDDRWHTRGNGGRFWGNGLLIHHSAGHDRPGGYVKVVRDRTDIRARDEALHNRVERLTQQLAEERNGASTLMHELRNSVAPLLNAVRIVATDVDRDVKARMQVVIARNVELIERVLQEAVAPRRERPERLRIESIVLQDLLNSAVDGVRPEAAAKQQSLTLVVPPAPLMIEVDPPRLHQMVLNLLSNAVKYTPTGGHIAVNAGVEGDMVVIRIDDDGVGIAPENLERVFDLFTRENPDGFVPGFGIGLAVVKRLASLHGGFVQVRSPGKGKGSQFALQLPLKHRPGTTE